MHPLVELSDVPDDIRPGVGLRCRIEEAHISRIAHPSGPAIRRVIPRQAAKQIFAAVEADDIPLWVRRLRLFYRRRALECEIARQLPSGPPCRGLQRLRQFA
jgi:hypothetical protein